MGRHRAPGHIRLSPSTPAAARRGGPRRHRNHRHTPGLHRAKQLETQQIVHPDQPHISVTGAGRAAALGRTHPSVPKPHGTRHAAEQCTDAAPGPAPLKTPHLNGTTRCPSRRKRRPLTCRGFQTPPRPAAPLPPQWPLTGMEACGGGCISAPRKPASPMSPE